MGTAGRGGHWAKALRDEVPRFAVGLRTVNPVRRPYPAAAERHVPPRSRRIKFSGSSLSTGTVAVEKTPRVGWAKSILSD
jgi:hypothetical protein